MRKRLTISEIAEQLRSKGAGPVNFIMTSTSAPRLEAINEMLVLPLAIDESPEQTTAVLLLDDEDENSEQVEAIIQQWQAYYRWLSMQDVPDIVIPYEAWLAENMNLQALWIRRAFNTVLSLIKTHALLHINLRLRDSKGHIIAMPEDYKEIYELIEPILRKILRDEVPKEILQVVEAVRTLTADGGEPTTVRAVAKYLRLDRSAASKRIQEAIDLGLLRNLEDEHNKPAKLALGDDSSGGSSAILPNPAILEEEAALAYAIWVRPLKEDGTPVTEYPVRITGVDVEDREPIAILAEEPYRWPLRQCRYVDVEEEYSWGEIDSENFSESSQNP